MGRRCLRCEGVALDVHDPNDRFTLGHFSHFTRVPLLTSFTLRYEGVGVDAEAQVDEPGAEEGAKGVLTMEASLCTLVAVAVIDGGPGGAGYEVPEPETVDLPDNEENSCTSLKNRGRNFSARLVNWC